MLVRRRREREGPCRTIAVRAFLLVAPRVSPCCRRPASYRYARKCMDRFIDYTKSMASFTSPDRVRRSNTYCMHSRGSHSAIFNAQVRQSNVAFALCGSFTGGGGQGNHAGCPAIHARVRVLSLGNGSLSLAPLTSVESKM